MPRAKLLHRLPVRLAGSILLLSAVTLITLTELGRRAVERLLLQQAEVQAALSTAAVVDGLDAVIGSAERTARLVAREFADRALTAAEAEKRARDILLDNPNLQAGIIAREGASGSFVAIEVHQADTATRFATRNLTTGEAAWPAPWYRDVLDKATPVWSEPYLDRGGSDRNVVRLAVPILRDPEGAREPVGAVAIVLDLEWLRRLANLQEFSDTSFTIVFSRSGRLILHPRPTYAVAETIETLAAKTGAPELLTIRQNILSRRQGSLTYAETAPSRRVQVNYKPARFGGWGVIVGFDEAEFLKTQRTYRLISFGLLGGLLLLLTGIVIVVTHLALRPLGQLAVAADEIARRNLDCTVPAPRREDEVGLLARSFLAMRDALKLQHLERRWGAQSIEHQLRYNQLIVDSMRELVFVLTKALHISRVNPATLKATGYDEAALLQAPIARIVQLTGEEAATADIKQALRDGTELHDLPATVLHREGRTLPMRLTFVPIRDSGRIVGGVVTLHDPSSGVS
ncbi:MAG: cache domain-containing protein [Verrucomicrobiota bacterium]